MTSGFRFEVISNTEAQADLLQDIAQRVMPSESAKALNRAVTFTRKEVAADVSQRTQLPLALIRRRVKQIRTQRASGKNLRTVGFVGEASVPVSKAKPKPRKAGRGVSYKTLPTTPANPSAFYAKMPSGKATAWYRKTRARTNLREVHLKIGPYLRRATRRVIRGPAQEYYDKTLTENMEKRMTKEIQKRGLGP